MKAPAQKKRRVVATTFSPGVRTISVEEEGSSEPPPSLPVDSLTLLLLLLVVVFSPDDDVDRRKIMRCSPKLMKPRILVGRNEF